MYREREILALIPARGGSKGLPGKNIKPLSGKPLIAWTVESALASGVFKTVMASTDDKNIAAIAGEAGADIPFLRPEALATDTATSLEVILHVLEWYRNEGHIYDAVALLQPTSPLRSTEDITSAVDLFINKDAQAVVSVCEVDHHPFWMNTIGEDLCMESFIKKEAENTPRQNLPPYYRLNGAIYVAKSDWLHSRKSFFGPGTYAYIMDRRRSVDIDDLLDFQLAEMIIAGQGK